MYEQIISALQTLSGWMWGPHTWVILAATGVYLSWKTRWFQVTKAGYYFKNTLGTLFKKKDPSEKKAKGEVSPFQAFTTAMAGTMGVGNLIGTTTAIMIGGPGAVFWMWIIAFFGITTKFAEILLAVHFRETTPQGTVLGGPMKYIERGLGPKWKPLAILFAIAGSLAAFGIGNLVQAQNVVNAFEISFGWDRQVVGAIVAILVGIVILGGIKSIGRVAERLVPLAAITMIIGSIISALYNVDQIPRAFYLIFTGAFGMEAGVGGFAGAGIALTIRYGLARGIFSNEAGLGSAPIAHAAAVTDHPVKQGLWGAIEVFLDTHVVATVVAIAVITSGLWTNGDATATEVFMGAFAYSWIGPTVGNIFSSVSIAAFAFTTMLGWSYYGEKCLEYLTSSKTNIPYRLIFVVMLFVGSFGVIPVWAVADIFNASMAIPNLIALIGLGTILANITKAYFNGEKYVPYDESSQYYNKMKTG